MHAGLASARARSRSRRWWNIARKLVQRTARVRQRSASSAEEVALKWALKQREKPRSSILMAYPRLPALAASQSIQGGAQRIGDGPHRGARWKLREELHEFARARPRRRPRDEFGDILFVTANTRAARSMPSRRHGREREIPAAVRAGGGDRAGAGVGAPRDGPGRSRCTLGRSEGSGARRLKQPAHQL
jgi:hypothetical protein